MGRKSDKKTKKDKKNKKMTGRQREQQRKIMKLAKLFKGKSSSSSSSSSSEDDGPRQNSQIQRNLRRQSLRMAAEALNEQLGLGLNSSSSNSSSDIPTDSWAAKAGTLAQALGTVLAAQPPTKRAVPKQDQPQKAGMPAGMPAFQPVAAPSTPPLAAWPPIPPNHPGVPCLPPPFSWFPPPPPLPFAGTVVPEPAGLMTKQQPAGPKAAQEQAAPKAAQEPPSVQVAKHGSIAMQIATMVDQWNLDTRKCNQCKQWTYYRNGICLNKQCPLNRPFTKQVYMFGKFYVYSM